MCLVLGGGSPTHLTGGVRKLSYIVDSGQHNGLYATHKPSATQLTEETDGILFYNITVILLPSPSLPFAKTEPTQLQFETMI